MGGFGVVLRALAILALLYLAWQQTKQRRDQARADLRAALERGEPVFRGERSACDEATRRLGESGIRSWSARSAQGWMVVVDRENQAEAQRLMGSGRSQS